MQIKLGSWCNVGNSKTTKPSMADESLEHFDEKVITVKAEVAGLHKVFLRHRRRYTMIRPLLTLPLLAGLARQNHALTTGTIVIDRVRGKSIGLAFSKRFEVCQARSLRGSFATGDPARLRSAGAEGCHCRAYESERRIPEIWGR